MLYPLVPRPAGYTYFESTRTFCDAGFSLTYCSAIVEGRRKVRDAHSTLSQSGQDLLLEHVN